LANRAVRVLLALLSAVAVGSSVTVIHANASGLSVWGQGGTDGWSEWTMSGVRLEEATIVLDRSAPGGSEIVAGTLEGPVREIAFDELIPSWNAHTPAGTWIETVARVRTDGVWTGWYSLGRWSSDGQSGNRRSVKGQDDDRVKILTDTLKVRGGADGYQLQVSLYSTNPTSSPELRLVAAVATTGAVGSSARTSSSIAPAELPVPERSQMIYPNGGEVWCSPTSTSMVMAYWADMTGNRGLDRAVPEVADGTYDPNYRGNGNWPFNTAYAGDAGLTAFVSRGSSLHDVERWLAAGVPVIASLGWAGGQLPEAPVSSTNGHLLVIVGVTEAGDIIVNDPAADPRRGQRVRRVYNRGAFESLWLSYSGGTVYLIYPSDHSAPL
jgi:hypothetical protein